MILYRPRAKDYALAMHNLKIFDSPLDMAKYLVNFHNLYNLLTDPNGINIFKQSLEEKADKGTAGCTPAILCWVMYPLAYSIMKPWGG